MKTISGWGNYPELDADVFTARDIAGQSMFLRRGFSGVARAMGRSYGDSALSSQSINVLNLDRLLSFDPHAGIVRCQSGVTLAQIIDVFLPRGWFLSVTPGTKYVSVGGAVASDVHGKNHHLKGSFCDHVLSIYLMLANGECIECSRDSHSELFHATCGGMGLTGVMQEVTLQLQQIDSCTIRQTTLRCRNLDEVMNQFDEYEDSAYSVAWIDCLARGSAMGRSLLMLGKYLDRSELSVSQKTTWSVPIYVPALLMNPLMVRVFNSLYYHWPVKHYSEVDYDSYFYPLDRLLYWNRLYGKRGFIQYQFVLPLQASRHGMRLILDRISMSGRGSFLAVLKKLGPENANYLSFPMQGYTLALDFRIDKGLLTFLDELDRIVLDHGGRIYLTKDARMSSKVFKNSYGQWGKFQEVREQYGAVGVFRSMQSDRLGL